MCLFCLRPPFDMVFYPHLRSDGPRHKSFRTLFTMTKKQYRCMAWFHRFLGLSYGFAGALRASKAWIFVAGVWNCPLRAFILPVCDGNHSLEQLVASKISCLFRARVVHDRCFTLERLAVSAESHLRGFGFIFAQRGAFGRPFSSSGML